MLGAWEWETSTCQGAWTHPPAETAARRVHGEWENLIQAKKCRHHNVQPGQEQYKERQPLCDGLNNWEPLWSLTTWVRGQKVDELGEVRFTAVESQNPEAPVNWIHVSPAGWLMFTSLQSTEDRSSVYPNLMLYLLLSLLQQHLKTAPARRIRTREYWVGKSAQPTDSQTKYGQRRLWNTKEGN